jgi:hypothetical protein
MISRPHAEIPPSPTRLAPTRAPLSLLPLAMRLPVSAEENAATIVHVLTDRRLIR